MTITKKILTGAALVIAALAIGTATSRASAIGLKENSIVTGDTITLGDVFYGLPHGEDKVLGIAPQPGRDMVLNARTLLRIAVAMDLPWRPATNADQVVLSRAATIVDRETIDIVLKEKLAMEGLTGNYKIVLAAMPDELVLPPDEQASVEVDSFTLKPDKSWFEATLAAPSIANPIQKIKVTGTVQNMIKIPVLKEALRHGTLISKYDLDMIEIREADLGPETIINAEELIGMTPRRVMIAGQPIRATEVEAPKIINRGDMVTMIFKKGALTLTAQGKALQPGTKGDAIRVVNTGSNKAVEGIVTAAKEITIEEF
jgi:flagella basal body P-ring formation protein FlgA